MSGMSLLFPTMTREDRLDDGNLRNLFAWSVGRSVDGGILCFECFWLLLRDDPHAFGVAAFP